MAIKTTFSTLASSSNNHVVLAYKNFSDAKVSHIGLGITAAYQAKTLVANGTYAEAVPVNGADDMADYIESQESTNRPVTHVIFCALWIPMKDMASYLVRAYPSIQFAVNCHSNVAFLQAEPPAITLLRDAMNMEATLSNFVAASNNKRLCKAMKNMYGQALTYLPNMYYLNGNEPINRPAYSGGPLKIGCFGSLRVYKNLSVAVAAAVELTFRLKTSSEIWMNTGRTDGGPDVVLATAQAWTANCPNIQLKLLPWANWASFKSVVGSMNILLAPSFTETFCNITADGITMGTPSVVSPAIEWTPRTWVAESDDSSHVAEVARHLLTDPHASTEGYEALQTYIADGLPYWNSWLARNQTS